MLHSPVISDDFDAPGAFDGPDVAEIPDVPDHNTFLPDVAIKSKLFLPEESMEVYEAAQHPSEYSITTRRSPLEGAAVPNIAQRGEDFRLK